MKENIIVIQSHSLQPQSLWVPSSMISAQTELWFESKKTTASLSLQSLKQQLSHVLQCGLIGCNFFCDSFLLPRPDTDALSWSLTPGPCRTAIVLLFLNWQFDNDAVLRALWLFLFLVCSMMRFPCPSTAVFSAYLTFVPKWTCQNQQSLKG